MEGCVLLFVIGSATSRPEIVNCNNIGGQIEKTRFVWEGSAGEAVCRGGERGGVMLLEFEDFAGERSVKDFARRSEGGGGFKGYRLCRRQLL